MSVNRSLPQHASLAGRIAHYMAKEPNERGCYLWLAGKDRDGYGVVRWEGKQYRVHRALWIQRHGPIPPGLLVCHECDDRSCGTDDHHFLGTNKVNMADRNAKLRHAFGERNAAAKVTDETVRLIREAAGSQEEIGRRFGLCQSQVSAIKRGERWAHVR